MTDGDLKAVEHLRSGNMTLAEIKVSALNNAAKKASQFIGDAEDSNDLLASIKVLETIGKMVGLTPKETQTNVQINAINGFDFIELDEEDIKQITMEEDFEEAEYDE